MKINRYITILMCFMILLGTVFTANAASENTAKQQIMDMYDNISDYMPPGDINNTAHGTSEFKVTSISGFLLSIENSLKKLIGADLKLDYKINYPENKTQTNYILNFHNNKYSGVMYIDNDKIIFSSEVLHLLRIFEPELGKAKNTPKYLYIEDKSLSGIRLNIDTNIFLTPEYRDLAAFFIEAVPEKYYNLSLTDQKIYFNLDQNGFEDVAVSVLQKIKNERERFDTLFSNYLKVSGGLTQEDKYLKEEILKIIDDSIRDGSYPDSREKLKKLLGSGFVLKEFKSEISLKPGGQNKSNVAVGYGNSDFRVHVVYKEESTSSREKLHDKYFLNITCESLDEIIFIFDVQITGELDQTATDGKSSMSIKVNINDIDNNVNFLNLVVEGKSKSKTDKNIQVNIPELTKSNSMKFEELIKNIPTILLDGVPVELDVDPYVVNMDTGSRIMVPLRNIAEALGCEVGWIEPDQVNIMRGDIHLTLFINKKTYKVNGIEKQLEVAPFVAGKRTIVPLRLISEELGCTVEYDSATNTVNIYSE